MRIQTPEEAGWAGADLLPPHLDCETAVLLRQVLLPILESAPDWLDLAKGLAAKGYGVTFIAGHMVLTNADSGAGLCTASELGLPLREIAKRLGRPAVRLNPDGHSAELDL